MTFEQALAAMRRGEKVMRKQWDRIFIFIADDFLYEGILNLHGGTRVIASMPCEEVPTDDILATDWQIVPSEVYEFNGA